MIKLIINKEKEEERMRGLYFTYGHILQTLQRFIPKEESQCSIILIYFLFMGKKILLTVAKLFGGLLKLCPPQMDSQKRRDPRMRSQCCHARLPSWAQLYRRHWPLPAGKQRWLWRH